MQTTAKDFYQISIATSIYANYNLSKLKQSRLAGGNVLRHLRKVKQKFYMIRLFFETLKHIKKQKELCSHCETEFIDNARH